MMGLDVAKSTMALIWPIQMLRPMQGQTKTWPEIGQKLYP